MYVPGKRPRHHKMSTVGKIELGIHRQDIDRITHNVIQTVTERAEKAEAELAKMREAAQYLFNTDCVCSMAAAVERAESFAVELADINDAYRVVMEEKCHPDEVHCTCVPYLRMGIAELRELVTWYFECLNFRREYFSELSDSGFNEMLMIWKHTEQELREMVNGWT